MDYDDKPKHKHGERQGAVSTLVCPKIYFDFRSPYSLEKCIHIVQFDAANLANRMRIWWYRQALRISATVERGTEDETNFLILIQERSGFRAKSRIEGQLSSLADGTLITGWINVPLPVFEICYALFLSLFATVILRLAVFFIVGVFLIGGFLVAHHFDKRGYQRYIRDLLGYQGKRKRGG